MSNDDQNGFIRELAALMKRWGLPPATGQLYGYLLLQDGPVDLDTICADLGTSKSGMSVAARQLESWFLVRAVSEPGSRRSFYEVDGDIERLLRVNAVQLTRFSDTLRLGAAATAGRPHQRLVDIADLFDLYVDASGKALTARHEES